MKKLREKFHSDKGFTLIEMLIVVAIISILIAVSIPTVNTALESAREATDAANERSFKAELMLCYMTGAVNDEDFKVGGDYAYNAQKGTIIYLIDDTTANTITGYGKGTTAGKDIDPKEGWILFGRVKDDGELIMGWGSPSVGHMQRKILTSDKLNG